MLTGPETDNRLEQIRCGADKSARGELERRVEGYRYGSQSEISFVHDQ